MQSILDSYTNAVSKKYVCILIDKYNYRPWIHIDVFQLYTMAIKVLNRLRV